MTVEDITTCSEAGDITAGAICSHLISAETSDLDMDGFLAFLAADPATGKAAAITISAEDYHRWKTTTEIMCRMLGKKCSYAVPQSMEKTK